MAPSQGRSTPPRSEAAVPPRPLPPRANLEHLKNEAKQLLRELRANDPESQLSDAQYVLAKAYGFTSWRALKAHVDAVERSVDAVLAAVKAGDVAALRAILDAHPELVDAAVENRSRSVRVLPTDTKAMRLLHVAVAENRAEAARVLLERGADPNVRNADGRMPLHDCCELAPTRDEIRDLLLRHGAEPDAAVAAFVPMIDRLRAILDRDPLLVNDRSTNLSPVAWATVAWSTEAVRLLLERGAVIDRPPYRDEIAWALTATASHEALRELLAQGFDAEYRFTDGDTLLHRVIRNRGTGDVTAFARVLLDAGFNVNATNAAGQTPLDVALATDGGVIEEYATGQTIGSKRQSTLIALLQKRGGEARAPSNPAALPAEVLHEFGSAIYRNGGDVEAVRAMLEEHPRLANSRPWAPRWLQTALEAVAGMCVWHRPRMHQIAKLLVERGAEADLPLLARAGLVDAVREKLETKPQAMNDRDSKGRTALYRAACVYGDFPEGEAVADLLLARGAEVDIWAACTFGLIDRVRELLADDPATADAVDPDGMRPLHWACRNRRNREHEVEIVRLLCEAGADVEAVNRQEDGMHPLHHCGEWMSRPEVADVLLAHGADINALAAENGWTPLDYAIDRKRQAIVPYFESKGGRRSTPEERAVAMAGSGRRGQLAKLLDAHPHLLTAEIAGPWGQPLLHWAAWEGQPEIVDELLKRGVDPNLRDKGDNAYAMHFAAEKGRLDIVRRLIDAGGDPHGEGDDHEMTVIGWATCLHGYHEHVARFLLEHGARHHIFSAVAMNDAETVRRIVREDPSQLSRKMSRNEHHRGVLHHAVAKNRPEMVRLLLELGADVHATDDSGATALTYATENADPAMLAMLQSAGAKLDVTGALRMRRYDVAEELLREDPGRIGPSGGDTIALHLLAQRDDAEAVRWLIAHGVDVNAKRVLWGCNHTALHVCAEHDRPEIAELLLDAGADPSIKDDKFHSDVMGWAQHCKRPRIVRLLEQKGDR